ncbi:hypothetical protein EYF80_026931 [Liparis tanakae]|uniref:Uncharacterized protein n=1 Tax=Liparis tanakae TaxID=230148 RepID=A0A4Z2HAR7_9TELE|nr:hypothetical protein EYF80_026931 [Liparis tanakae]
MNVDLLSPVKTMSLCVVSFIGPLILRANELYPYCIVIGLRPSNIQLQIRVYNYINLKDEHL